MAENLADVERRSEVFEAVSLETGPEVPADLRHDELLGALQFTAARLSWADAQNRMGQQVAQSFRDYAEQSRIQPLNPRILKLLADDIRAVLLDAHLSAGLDAFDLTALRGVLAAHDAFLRDYYSRALLGLRHKVTADTQTLQRELFPKLAAAQKVIDASEILAPSVGKVLDMVRRDAERIPRILATAHDPERVAAAKRQLDRDAVLATGFLGRIVTRLQAFGQSETGRWRKDKIDGVDRAMTIYGAARLAADLLLPIARALWTLIAGTPPPF